jgi:cobaltochelatase CobS
MDYTSHTRPQLIEAYKNRFGSFDTIQQTPAQRLRQALETDTAIDGTENRSESPTRDVPSVPSPNLPGASSAPAASAGAAGAGLMQLIAAEVSPQVAATVRKELEKQFAEALDQRPRTVEVTIKGSDLPPVEVGITHRDYDDILALVAAGVSVYLHGPKGSGKSTIAEQIAKALGVPSYITSFSDQSQDYELFGIPGINGHAPQESPTWKAWRDGGVILWDEMDACPAVSVKTNAMLANGRAVFADGKEYRKSDKCYVMGAGNTAMAGATAEFTGRNRLDAATLDRWYFVPFDYDEALETAVAGEDQVKWTRHIQAIRKAWRNMGASAPDTSLIPSPRASIVGAKLLRTVPSMTFSKLEDGLVWRGLPTEDRNRVMAAVRKGGN